MRWPVSASVHSRGGCCGDSCPVGSTASISEAKHPIDHLFICPSPPDPDGGERDEDQRPRRSVPLDSWMVPRRMQCLQRLATRNTNASDHTVELAPVIVRQAEN